MEVGEKFLPIGTVVMLNGGKKRVMITGFLSAETSDDGAAIPKDAKIYDYTGCLYPEGILRSTLTCLFDHEQIQEVYHMGLEDDEEGRKYIEQIKTLDNELKQKKENTTENPAPEEGTPMPETAEPQPPENTGINQQNEQPQDPTNFAQ